MGSLALLSSQRVTVWHDDVSLWTAAIPRAPVKTRPPFQLVKALIAADQIDAAERVLVGIVPQTRADEDYRRANQAAIWIARGFRDQAFALLEFAQVGSESWQIRTVWLHKYEHDFCSACC